LPRITKLNRTTFEEIAYVDLSVQENWAGREIYIDKNDTIFAANG